MKIIESILVVVFLLTLTVTAALAYDGETHGDINKNIAEITDTNSKDLNSYLKNLGFDDGIKTIFCVETTDCITDVRVWLSLGGEQEDEPLYFRSQNHFHNPLNPWDEAGLDHLLFSGQSSIIWSQDQSNGRLVDLGGDWSWTTARKFYYAALTGDSMDLDGFVVEDGLVKKTTITGKTEMNENERSPFFAWTFRALGQVMHLAQDASVPAHTRNDVHVLYNYEKAVQKLRLNKDDIYLDTVANPISFAPFILDDASDSLAPIPIAKIIDTDAYVSDNPSVTASQAIGLAEYSNANFFSQSTCANSDLFLYPNVSDECTELDTKNFIIDGEEREVQYYKKIACGENNDGQGYLLSLVDALEWWREFLALIGYDINMLDEEVYKDYAKLLIPRAVGYSKGLLDYFFRGDIDLEFNTADDGYKLINNGDESLDGIFSLYYDDADGIRRLVTSFGNMQVNPGDYVSVNFTPPTDYDPKVPNEYMLVFRGKMGEEPDGVAARKVDVTPPPYLMVTMTTQADDYYIKIDHNLLPDVIIIWDMMRNDYARIPRKAELGGFIEFPIEFDELSKQTNFEETNPQITANPLLTIKRASGRGDDSPNAYCDRYEPVYDTCDYCEDRTDYPYSGECSDIQTKSSIFPGKTVSASYLATTEQLLSCQWSRYNDNTCFNDYISGLFSATGEKIYIDETHFPCAGANSMPKWTVAPLVNGFSGSIAQVKNLSGAEDKYLCVELNVTSIYSYWFDRLLQQCSDDSWEWTAHIDNISTSDDSAARMDNDFFNWSEPIAYIRHSQGTSVQEAANPGGYTWEPDPPLHRKGLLS